MPGGPGQVGEDAADFVCQPSLTASKPLLEQGEVRLVATMEVGGNQVILAREVVVQRPLGYAGLFGHGVHAHRPDALAVEQLAGRSDDALARWGLHRQPSECIPTSEYTCWVTVPSLPPRSQEGLDHDRRSDRSDQGPGGVADAQPAWEAERS